MLHNTTITFVAIIIITSALAEIYINTNHPKPWKVRFYPKKSMFRKADLIDKGCSVFIRECPEVYKKNYVCARHYDGKFKTFINYCELEYENCNSWRQWSMVKNDRC